MIHVIFDCSTREINTENIDDRIIQQAQLDIATNKIPLAPDITGLIKALTASPTIDSTTKKALIDALQGV